MKKIKELVTSTEKPEQLAKNKSITFGSFKRTEDKKYAERKHESEQKAKKRAKSFASFKRAEEREVAERKQREHEAELASIAEDARIQRAVEDEHERVIKEQNTIKRNKYVTESLSNAFKPKVKDMDSVREQAIDTYLPKEFIPSVKDYPEPFKDEPALNKELSEFKLKINEHLHKGGFASSGGGGIGNLNDANDINKDSTKVDGKFLQWNASQDKYIGADPSISSLEISKLDIDGGTDIGAAIVDADLLIIDDGAGGTNRKTAASRIKTYVADITLTTAAQTNITSLGTLTALTVDNIAINGANIGHTSDADSIAIASDGVVTFSQAPVFPDGSIAVANLDIDGGTDIGANLADADLFIVDDGAGGTNRKTAASRIKTYIADVTLTTAAQTAITSLGTLTTLTVDSIIINGATIGHTSDTDAITIASDGDVTLSQNLVVTGDFTVNGTTTTVSTTNMKVSDTLIELNTGATSNANDMGIIMERGSTGNNAIFMFDESADEFTVGTTTATNDATGNISITAGTFTAATLKGNLVVANDGDIGSVGATDAMQISSAGIVTFKDDIVLKDACTIGTATTAGAIAIAADGTVDLDVAGATVASAVIKTAGKESIWVPAAAMKPTVSNPCSDLQTVETTGGRPDMNVLDFATGADEFAQFAIAFPKSWNLGTITFQAFWSGIAATTDCDWSLQGVGMNDNETIDVAYGTAVVVSDNAQGAVEELLVSAESGAVTIAGTPADNDLTFFRIGRDVSGDNMDGDARLHGLKIFFTTDSANDA